MADAPAENHDPLSPRRRGRILSGAAAIFVAEGYEGASMSRIAAEAGVSKGTLYNYYADKRELFAAYIRESCGLLIDEMFGETPPAETPRAGLTRIGHSMLKMMVSPRGNAMFRLVVMEAAKFPDLAAVFYQAGPEKAVDGMTLWLQAQIDAGQLRLDDPELAAEQFFALTQTRLVLLVRLNPGLNPGDAEIAGVVAQAVTMFLAVYGTATS